MIFNYIIIPEEHKTLFTFEVEEEEEMCGFGENKSKLLSINSKKGSVYFDYILKKPHNDLLAFMIIIIFFPFIKNKITFKFPISNRIDTVVKMFFKNLIINANIVDLVKYKGDNKLITVGGGMDSTSIMCMFKDAYCYHQLSKEKVNVDLICEKLNMVHKPFCIDTNMTKYYKGYSFPHWFSIFIGGLLIAMDNNVGCLMHGSPLGVVLLQSKRGQFNLANSRWNPIEAIGLTQVCPLAGCTELISCKILVDHNAFQYAVWCDGGKDNKGCHKCSKCFRKNFELYLNGVSYSSSYFNNYSEEVIKNTVFNPIHLHNFLHASPLFYKHIPKLNKILSKINYNATWCNKIYPKVYLDIRKNDPNNELYKDIFEKLLNYSKPMSSEDIQKLETYNSNDYLLLRDKL